MADEKAKDKPTHSLADHALGADLDHVHDGEADHDHDHLPDLPPEENPLWQADHVSLTSVGIDIGSAGTQVVFSRVHLRRFGEDLTSRYYVTARETLHRSPVSLTPYRSEEQIDGAALGAIIDEAYASARLQPADIDTGVVILTGEALRRENAQAIADVIAKQGGDLVTASAGHHMEAMLAAYGSGAARVSADRKQRLLNIDIGGGTAKLAVIENGRVAATAAVHIGGRLLAVDAGGNIVRLDPAGRHHAARAGFDWRKGDRVRPADLDRVAEAMADALVAAIRLRPLSPEIAALFLTEPIALDRIDGIMCSGGVAEYIYEREQRDFGDLGCRLGRIFRRRLDEGALPWPLLPAGECIRATALGASEYSVQLSGNTCYISNPGKLLPRRNLQVLQPPFVFEDTIDPAKLAAAIRAHLTAFDVADGAGEVALAFRWQGPPSHERIFAFAQGIARGIPNTLAYRLPLYIMLDGDVAHTLGAVLREELNIESEILVLDGLTLWDFDYIDLGRIRLPSNTVPVTIKSLVFSEDPRLPAGHAHLGHDHRHDHDHRRQ
ncbi:MAG TPA: ethanolamine ammonia-lyase reactivating factor EutA [Xanthobacteraceae bacterium]|nr:ethanolamine ammonia-lyase reactivating factor EutA [Xanthobacteraceae bacterium]